MIQDQLFLLLPFLVSPLLIWGLRRLLTWWYHRKIIKNEKKLELLKQRKLKILDEVMRRVCSFLSRGFLFRNWITRELATGLRRRVPLRALA